MITSGVIQRPDYAQILVHSKEFGFCSKSDKKF